MGWKILIRSTRNLRFVEVCSDVHSVNSLLKVKTGFEIYKKLKQGAIFKVLAISEGSYVFFFFSINIFLFGLPTSKQSTQFNFLVSLFRIITTVLIKRSFLKIKK